jgi:membrane-associated phospholipid phosphatase
MKKWLILSLLLLSLTFVYDWPLAQFFVLFDQDWAHLLKVYGHLPSFYLGLLSLYGYAQSQSFFKKAFLITVVILGSFAWVYYLSLSLSLDVILGTLILFLSLILWTKAFEHMPKDRMKAWFKLSTLIFLLAFFGPNLIKLFVLRFRPTLYFPGCMTYSLLLKPYLLNLEVLHQSFPSGHTALSMSLFSLVFLVKHSSLNRKVITVLISVFVMVMAVSRLVLGDHFSSDVIFSMIAMGF